MEDIHVSIRIPPGDHRVPELAAFAADCEQAGLDGIGVPDHHHVGRDAYVVLSAMAHATRRLTLFPATSNVATRHPMVLASLINSLDELAPGRVMLTCAPGFLSVEKSGVAKPPRDQLGQAVTALRGLLNDGFAPYDGHELVLHNRPANGSRVIMLASGPKLLELAGAVADGVMMLVGLDPRSVAAAREHVRRGAESVGRDPASLEETLIVPIGIGNRSQVRRWPQTWFREGHPWLNYPSVSNLRWLRYAGIDLDTDHDPTEISDETADRICDAFGLFGTAQQCAERLLRARQEVGIGNVFLFPAHTNANHYELPRAEVQAYSEAIGPALADAGVS